jgi:peptidyl-prolyl cis-trans isomerase SurA
VQLQLAASQGIQVDDETLNEALNPTHRNKRRHALRVPCSLEEVSPRTSASRSRRIIIQLLRKRMVDDRITVTERRSGPARPRSKPEPLQSDEYHIAHILIAIPEAASREIEKASKKAQAGEVAQGADFQQTAIAVSEGNRRWSGDLGWRKVGELPTCSWTW